jgi:hypothetical protein
MKKHFFDPIIVKKYERTLVHIEEMIIPSPKLGIGNITFISYF